MTGKRADQGHVDLFVLFNCRQKKKMANGQITNGQFYTEFLGRNRIEILKITGKRAKHGFVSTV